MSLSRPLLLLAFSVFVLQVSDQPNKLIEHPEQFGGAWETTTVSGIDGIFIQIQADTHQAPLRSGQSVDIWLYHRERGEQTGGWANVVTYDSNAASGAVASNHSDTFFDGTRLHIGFAGHGDQKPVDLPFDLDVTYSPSSQQWTGIWTRSDESRSVTLERPKPSGGFHRPCTSETGCSTRLNRRLAVLLTQSTSDNRVMALFRRGSILPANSVMTLTRGNRCWTVAPRAFCIRR